MFVKYASWGDPIETYSKNNSNIKLASTQTFGDIGTFPYKYAASIQQYITAIEKSKYEKNKMHIIGNYDPDFHYYRVISVHGNVPNDNGDMFLWGEANNPDSPELLRFEEGLGRYIYQTFIGRGNFKNHKNDDVSLAVGINLDVLANHNGKFIENLLAVDNKKDPELVRSIDKGYIQSVSMGAKVGRSLCSICNNVARTEAEYCNCIKYNKGGNLYVQGQGFKPVYEDNREVNFIELSWVTVPADRDALLLEKIASHYREDKIDAIATLMLIYGEEKTKKILYDIKKYL